MSEMFAKGNARRTVPTALMFFFGYMTTSMVVNWLPTVLSHREASPLMVSSTFAALNVGSAVGSLGLGFLSSKIKHPVILGLAWLAAGLCAIGSAMPGLQLLPFALLAVAAYTIAAGSQALAVAFAMGLHRGRNLESSSVGFMVSSGRVGQFGALGLSGILIGFGWPETGLFAFAGISACFAALIALFVVRAHASMHDGASEI